MPVTVTPQHAGGDPNYLFLKSWYYVPHDRARGTRIEEHKPKMSGAHYPISLVGRVYVPRCKITPSVGKIEEHYPVLS